MKWSTLIRLAPRLALVVLPAALLLGACGSSPQGRAAPAESSATTVTATRSSTATSSASPTSRTSSPAASRSVPVPRAMPDYVGQKLADVQATLAQYNVQIKTVNKIDAQPAGTVIEQDPVAGRRAPNW